MEGKSKRGLTCEKMLVRTLHTRTSAQQRRYNCAISRGILTSFEIERKKISPLVSVFKKIMQVKFQLVSAEHKESIS